MRLFLIFVATLVAGFSDSARLYHNDQLQLEDNLYSSESVISLINDGLKDILINEDLKDILAILYRVQEPVTEDTDASSVEVHYPDVESTNFAQTGLNIIDLVEPLSEEKLQSLLNSDDMVLVQVLPKFNSVPEIDFTEEIEEIAEINTLSNSTANSLFTKYQFFTPGIWSCLIVSGLLISVLYIALTWISSIEITYGAFEKQVDFAKKTE